MTRNERDQPVTKIIVEDSVITKEFHKLLQLLDQVGEQEVKPRRGKLPTKLYRHGRGFYALRHTFETIAGESRDQVAVDFLMGHADHSMAGVYRERISDERLLAVTNHLHDWLFPSK